MAAFSRLFIAINMRSLTLNYTYENIKNLNAQESNAESVQCDVGRITGQRISAYVFLKTILKFRCARNRLS